MSEARAMYLNNMRQRTMPPRFRPFMIILFVFTLGMVFAGLAMTIIGHWPGYSTPGGKQGIKIAGPTILSIGLAGFIAGLFLAYSRTQHEKKKWEAAMKQIASTNRAGSGRVYMRDNSEPGVRESLTNSS